VPADGSYLAVLRTATAGLAARLQFTLDEIEDLRIAVDEACAILLSIASDNTEVTSQFEVTDSALSIDVSVPVTGPAAALPGGNSFSWQVLTALAGEVSAKTDGDRAAIRLTKRRSLPPSG
jgi:serine/threonine-protein kinase RsbW